MVTASKSDRLLDAPYRVRVTVLAVFVHVFYGIEHVYASIAAPIAVALLLLLPLDQARYAWMVFLVPNALLLYAGYYEFDNHRFLLVYFGLAMLLASLVADDALFRSRLYSYTRYLICLLFCFAVFQKLRSPDYLDGQMFELLFAIDHRFFTLAEWTLGPETAKANLEAARAFRETERAALVSGGPAPVLEIVITPAYRALADVLAWINLLYQAALAALVFARNERLLLAKHLLSTVFIIGTYVVAPVYSFGMLLCVMFYILAEEERPRFRAVYVWLILLLSLYQVVFNAGLGLYAVPGG